MAIHVVLRRDMSLNRRIYSWFTGHNSNASASSSAKNSNVSTASTPSAATTPGSESMNTTADSNHSFKKSESQSQTPSFGDSSTYFNTHSKQLLIISIKILLNNKKDSSNNQILYLFNEEPTSAISTSLTTLPNSSTLHGNLTSGNTSNTNTILNIIKIVSNLVERQEIGQNIIDDILLDLLLFIYKECNSLSNTQLSMNTASLINSSMLAFNKAGSNLNTSNQQNLKEIKKATCNFLFQSFQLYFIWDFCANKFEKICKNSTTSVNNSANNLVSSSGKNFDSLTTNTDLVISPAQLCDLYKFILDLLTNSVR